MHCFLKENFKRVSLVSDATGLSPAVAFRFDFGQNWIACLLATAASLSRAWTNILSQEHQRYDSRRVNVLGKLSASSPITTSRAAQCWYFPTEKVDLCRGSWELKLPLGLTRVRDSVDEAISEPPMSRFRASNPDFYAFIISAPACRRKCRRHIQKYKTWWIIKKNHGSHRRVPD